MWWPDAKRRHARHHRRGLLVTVTRSRAHRGFRQRDKREPPAARGWASVRLLTSSVSPVRQRPVRSQCRCGWPDAQATARAPSPARQHKAVTVTKQERRNGAKGGGGSRVRVGGKGGQGVVGFLLGDMGVLGWVGGGGGGFFTPFVWGGVGGGFFFFLFGGFGWFFLCFFFVFCFGFFVFFFFCVFFVFFF